MFENKFRKPPIKSETMKEIGQEKSNLKNTAIKNLDKNPYDYKDTAQTNNVEQFNAEQDAIQNAKIAFIGMNENDKRQEYEVFIDQVKEESARWKLELAYQKQSLEETNQAQNRPDSPSNQVKKSLIQTQIERLEQKIGSYGEVASNIADFEPDVAKDVWQNKLEEKTFVAPDKLGRQWLIGHGNVRNTQLEDGTPVETHYMQDPEDAKKSVGTLELLERLLEKGEISPARPVIVNSCHIAEDQNLVRDSKAKLGLDLATSVKEEGVVYTASYQLEGKDGKVGDLVTSSFTK